VNKTGNKCVRVIKQTASGRKKNGDYIIYLKGSVILFVE